MAFGMEQRAGAAGGGLLRLADDRGAPRRPAGSARREPPRRCSRARPRASRCSTRRARSSPGTRPPSASSGSSAPGRSARSSPRLIFPDHLQTARSGRPAAPARRARRPRSPSASSSSARAARDGREIPVDIATARSIERRRRRSSPSTSATRASAASASASSTPTPGGARPCSTSASSRSRAWRSTSSCSGPSASRSTSSASTAARSGSATTSGETLTLRASVGWPDRAAATPGPARDRHPARLHAAARPGRDRRRGLPPRGPVQPVEPDGRRARVQSSISIRIPGDPGRLRLARRRLREPAPLRAQRHQPVRLARADCSAPRSSASRVDRLARRRGAPDPHADRAAALDHLPGRARRRRASGTSSPPRSRRSLGYTVEEWMADPDLWERIDPPRRPRAGARGRGRLRAREPPARHRLPDPQARRRR